MMSIQTPPLSSDNSIANSVNDKSQKSIKKRPRSKTPDLTTATTTTTTDSKKRKIKEEPNEEESKDKEVIIIPSKSNNSVRNDVEFSGKIYSSLIHSALDSLDKKDSTAIESLAMQIALPSSNPESISITNLNIILKTLINEISRLDNKRTLTLIQSILKINWFNYSANEEFKQRFSTFLKVLVSGIPKWWNDVADSLISDFIKHKSDSLEMHHNTLHYIIQIIPTSTNSFPSLLRKHYPSKNASKKELVNYVINLLKLLDYCEELRYPVWSLLVENCIKLDVELQNELEDVDDDDLDDALNSDVELSDEEFSDNEEEEIDKAKNDNEGEVAYGGDDTDSEDEALLEEEEEYNIEIQSISGLSSKLDNIMQILLTHTATTFDGENTGLFNTLTSLFKSHVLPTHYTRYIQYLMFNLSQQHTMLTDSFLALLIDVVFNVNEVTSNRIKAMQYVSSFIARAKMITRQQLKIVLSYLTSWCTAFVSEREKEIGNGEGGMERFKMLYCVFQGLLYIFCFRFRELKNERDEWELQLDKFYNKLIISGFNPLKYCNETVVLIFARVAQKVDLCYCYSIIERNKRERLNGIKGSAYTLGAKNADGNNFKRLKFESKQEFLDLEAYFPFDPMMLKKCKRIVNENYIEWVNIDDDDSE